MTRRSLLAAFFGTAIDSRVAKALPLAIRERVVPKSAINMYSDGFASSHTGLTGGIIDGPLIQALIDAHEALRCRTLGIETDDEDEPCDVIPFKDSEFAAMKAEQAEMARAIEWRKSNPPEPFPARSTPCPVHSIARRR